MTPSSSAPGTTPAPGPGTVPNSSNALSVSSNDVHTRDAYEYDALCPPKNSPSCHCHASPEMFTECALTASTYACSPVSTTPDTFASYTFSRAPLVGATRPVGVIEIALAANVSVHTSLPGSGPPLAG